jgi:hypothetical protein
MLVRLHVPLLMLSWLLMLTEMSIWLFVLLLWLLEVLFDVVVKVVVNQNKVVELQQVIKYLETHLKCWIDNMYIRFLEKIVVESINWWLHCMMTWNWCFADSVFVLLLISCCSLTSFVLLKFLCYNIVLTLVLVFFRDKWLLRWIGTKFWWRIQRSCWLRQMRLLLSSLIQEIFKFSKKKFRLIEYIKEYLF